MKRDETSGNTALVQGASRKRPWTSSIRGRVRRFFAVVLAALVIGGGIGFSIARLAGETGHAAEIAETDPSIPVATDVAQWNAQSSDSAHASSVYGHRTGPRSEPMDLAMEQTVAGSPEQESSEPPAPRGESPGNGLADGDRRLATPVDRQQATAPATFRNVAAAVLPVVVEVSTVEVVRWRDPSPQFPSPFEFFFGPREEEQDRTREYRRPGLGSGVIVRQDNDAVYVLTNNHVVEGATEITVGLYDGREFPADIVGGDTRTDLALLSFRTGEDVPIARLGDSDRLHVGDWVIAVGNPFGFESTVTAGIVSALGRRSSPGGVIAGFADFIQTDAAINPGNSGGALANLEGEIIGINTWIASRDGGSVGIGFAVPINLARRAIDDLIEEGEITYGWLGVSIVDVHSDAFPAGMEDLGVSEGALVLNVYRESPAARDGIRPGDVVKSVEGEPVRDSFELTRKVGQLLPGREAEFVVVRDGRRRTFAVTIDRRASEEVVTDRSQLWPGFAVAPLTDELRAQRGIAEGPGGLLLMNVERGTPAAMVGLRAGDVIHAVNGRSVETAREFYRELAEANGREVTLRIVRNGVQLSLGIPGLANR